MDQILGGNHSKSEIIGHCCKDKKRLLLLSNCPQNYRNTIATFWHHLQSYKLW